MVIKATEGFPGSYVNMGIDCENDDITFEWCSTFDWAGRNTSLAKYKLKKYRFIKVNEQSVNNGEEFRAAIASLSEGDPVTFTLAKNLYSTGVQFLYNFTKNCYGPTLSVKSIFVRKRATSVLVIIPLCVFIH